MTQLRSRSRWTLWLVRLLAAVTAVVVAGAGIIPALWPLTPSVADAPALVEASWRTGTISDAWSNADVGPTGGRLCPTCGTEVTVEPGSGPRDWDINHEPPWSQRTFPPDVTRREVIENYQQGTNLECPTCNRSRGAG